MADDERDAPGGLSRRTLLALTAAGAAGIAGCGSGDGDVTTTTGEASTTGAATSNTGATSRPPINRGTPAGTTTEPPAGTGETVYVSPDGDDAWTGRSPAPGEGDEGPLRTLEAARDAIRRQKRGEGLPEGGVTVALRGGEYRRTDRSFELDGRDSGTAGSPIVYRAYEDEDVRIVGGRTLSSDGFRPVSDDDVRERLPSSSREDVLEYDLAAEGITQYGSIVTMGLNLPRSPPAPELFVDGEAMELARWPDDGWTAVGEVHDPGARPRDSKEHFTERPLPEEFDHGATFEYTDDRPESWVDYDDVWMQGYWWNFYATSNLGVEAFDASAGTITTEQAHLYSVREGQRYYYYNVLDELDRPGEFYIDRERGMLYLYPPRDLDGTSVELSILADPIVRMVGTSHVAFVDLEFAVSRGSAVQLVSCEHCQLRSCRVDTVGTMGVVLGDDIDAVVGGIDGGRHNAVVDCEITGTGMGAVKLGGGDRQTLEPGNNAVVGCELRDFSRVLPTYTPAVWPTGVGGHVAHNDIHDSPHVAILIGGNEHVVEYNHVHDVVQETSDAGAIYMGRDWSEVGNVIRNNYIHGLHSDVGDGQYAVYLDDLASGTVVEDNVIADVPAAASIGGGRHNTFSNNVLVECDESVRLDARGLDPDWPHCRRESAGGSGVLFRRLAAVPSTEDPWASRYPWLSIVPTDDPCMPDANTIACNLLVDSPPMEIARAARATGTVRDNLVTDPPVGFEDPAAGRYGLASDSRVFEELPCFEDVPFEQIGPPAGAATQEEGTTVDGGAGGGA